MARSEQCEQSTTTRRRTQFDQNIISALMLKRPFYLFISASRKGFSNIRVSPLEKK